MPKRLGPGALPAPAPSGARVVWVNRGQVWTIDLGAVDAKAAQLFTARGAAQQVAWAPDGASLAYLRQFAAARPAMCTPHRAADEPWAIRVADVKSGAAREIFKADEGAGSAFQAIVARNQVL